MTYSTCTEQSRFKTTCQERGQLHKATHINWETPKAEHEWRKRMPLNRNVEYVIVNRERITNW